jgi:tetratricopeptide (TPR) repeat protein
MKYAEQAFQKVTKSNSEKTLSLLVKSIELMPSNNWAWFNFASISNDLERFDEAQNAFLVAALFADWDREAWIKSLFLAFNLKKDYLFFEIVNALNHKYGDSIKQQLSDFIFSQSQMELSKRKGFYDAIENIFNSINNPDKLNLDKDDIV